MQEKVGLLLTMDLSVELSPVHGQVLAQWPKMFQILSQFCKSMACIQMSDYIELWRQYQRVILLRLTRMEHRRFQRKKVNDWCGFLSRNFSKQMPIKSKCPNSC
jgi:hypothetical protein